MMQKNALKFADLCSRVMPSILLAESEGIRMKGRVLMLAGLILLVVTLLCDFV